MIRLALLLVLTLLLPATPAAANPAHFVARAPGLTIYLFGSFHALPAGTKWETPVIDHAFDTSDQAWFEAILADSATDILAKALSEGLDHEHKLSDRLTPAERTRLVTVLATLPLLRFGMIDAMRPWLAAMTIGVARTQSAGFDNKQGVEPRLQDRAKAAHKPLTAIEDPAETLHSLAILSDAEGLAMLREALSAKSPDTLLRPLLKQWLAGNVDAIGRLMAATPLADEPIARTLLATRNAAWANCLAALKGSQTTIFLTVGAGHLAGRDNLRTLLARKGFTLTRLPN